MLPFHYLNSKTIFAIFISGLFPHVFSLTSIMPPPPANDSCNSASVITLPGNGYGVGTVYSDTVSMEEATAESGEFFYFPSLAGKSVWFEFILTTSREVKIYVEEVGVSTTQDWGYTIYNTGNCLPTLPQVFFPSDNPNYYGNPCMAPGMYKVQIHSSTTANNEVFLELQLNVPNATIQPSVAPPYDLHSNAYPFGILPPANFQTVTHELDCHSVDTPQEFDCLPVPNPSEYTKSSWYTFTTDNYEDYLAFQVYGSQMPDLVGFRLMEGDVTIVSDPFTLPIVHECVVGVKTASSTRIVEEICSLKANTTYSFEWVFPQNYSANLQVRVYHLGKQPTTAPQAIKSQLGTNALGTVPNGTTNLKDWFACNAQMFLNDCPPLNPGTGLTYNGKMFDLATFATFELSTDANVCFKFSNMPNYPYVRILNGDLTDDCSTLDPATDLFAEFDSRQYCAICLPAGKHTLQILGHTGYPFPQTGTYFKTVYDEGLLGREFTLEIEVAPIPSNSSYDLEDQNSINIINGGTPLGDGVLYASQPDTFVCRNTVLPEGSTCDVRQKGIYRQINIGPNGGLLDMQNLLTDDFFYETDIHYRLEKGDMQALATAQQAFSPGKIITGSVNYLGQDYCIENSPDFIGFKNFFCCVETGTYNLISLGGDPQVNLSDAPSFLFKSLNPTQHFSPATAQNMGNVTNLTSVQSDTDWFSCLENPATIAGIAPCNNATKLIYREFYLSEEKIIRIYRAAQMVGNFVLFSGQASNPSSILTPWSDLNSVQDPWATCFTDQQTSDCFPLPAGWYTVVAYGNGPGYGKPILNGNGNLGNTGSTNSFVIEIGNPQQANYNRPWKAYDAGITDWNFTNDNQPYVPTSLTYTFGTETFVCQDDLPWTQHPIVSCNAAFTHVAYYVFEITEPSFVAIQGISNAYWTEVFPFNVQTNAADLLTIPPIYPCVTTPFKQLCDLPAGTYTLVVFAKDSEIGEAITPILYVDKVGYSRSDFAVKSYDWGVVPNDNQWRNGKPGDTNVAFPGAAPSYDVFYCTTGSGINDPDNFFNNTSGHIFNPNIYNPVYPYVLYTNNLPTPNSSGNQQHSWRNIWQTFVLTGSGEATIQVDFPTQINQLHSVSVFEYSGDGNSPFDELIQFPSFDSTSQSLEFVAGNFDYYWTSYRYKSLKFNKNGCLRDSVRYFALITMLPGLPNQPFELSIKYEELPTNPPLYDHIGEANVINNLQQTAPPYNTSPLGTGWYMGAPSVLQCTTTDPTDPFSCSAVERTLWYEIHVGVTGLMRLALEENFDASTRDYLSSGALLYRMQQPGNTLTRIYPNTLYASSSSQDTIYHDWSQTCVEPGIYYLMFNDCFNELDIVDSYRPIVWLLESPGDRCAYAVPLEVPGIGGFSATVDVRCHTLGGDFGEDGSSVGCLSTFTNTKTSWIKITLTGSEKLDLEFQVNATGINTQVIKYRILYGSCTAMTPGPCNGNASSIFGVECLTAGDYYVQIVTPANAAGEVTINVTASLSQDQNCQPIDPTLPVANFIYQANCDSVVFENLSSSGVDIEYLWQFPNGETSMEQGPVWYPDTPGSYEVSLTVINLTFGTSIISTQTIEVSSPVAGFDIPDRILCNGASALLDAFYPGAEYLWWDNTKEPTNNIGTSGSYWVQISLGSCSVTDSFEVVAVSSDTSIQVNLCPGESAIIGNEVYDSLGIFQQVLTNVGFAGCDSILNITVIMHQASDTTILETTCNTSLVGTQTTVYENENGCDSIVTVTTIFDSTYLISTVDTFYVCDPVQIGNDTSTYTTLDGCDSTAISTTLLLIPNETSEILYTCHPDEAGTETFVLASYLGCDSIINITETIYDPALIDTTFLDVVHVCDPAEAGSDTMTHTSLNGCDSLVISFFEYFPPDTLNDYFQTCNPLLADTTTNYILDQLGCIETVLISETVYDPNAVDTIQESATTCDQLDDGLIIYETIIGADGCEDIIETIYSYLDPVIINQVEVTCNPALADTSVQIYPNQYGCDSAIVTNIVNYVPPNFSLTTEASDYNGFGTSCPDVDDGFIEIINVTGGTAPYSYLWSNGAVADNLDNLTAGNYEVTLTDAEGCEQTWAVILDAPPYFDIAIEEGQPGCEGEGFLNISATGETGPYLYSLNNGVFSTSGQFLGLEEGPYQITVQDANNCEQYESTALTSLMPINLFFQNMEISLHIGESIQLQPVVNVLPDSIVWTPSSGLSCTDCLLPIAMPSETTEYQIEIWSDGYCPANASVLLKVDSRPRIYVPNAFSPNDDGPNDLFQIYSGPEVVKVHVFRIFDRWGGKVYEAFDFLPNSSVGWDGNSHGKPLQPGVFVWYSEVELMEGQHILLEGEVHLLR